MDIVTRAEWGAQAPRRDYDDRVAVSAVIVHHTADELGFSFRRKHGRPGPKYWAAAYKTNKKVQNTLKAYKNDDSRLFAKECDAMRGIQNYHRNVLGWTDIGYHFIIFPSGRVYQGRPVEASGAHTVGYNNWIGVCFAGNFEKEHLTPQARASYDELIADLKVSKANIKGHYRVNPTACPGKNIKSKLGV